MVQPNSEGNNAVIGTSVSPTSGRYVSIILFPGGSVEAKANTVYYVTDKGIGFSKTYDELGIAAAFFEQWETLGMESVLQKVRPNLEKMIRENLTPSEAKE